MKQQPAVFFKLLVLLVPRKMQIEDAGGVKAMTDEQIEQAIEAIQGMPEARAGDSPKVTDAVPEPVALPAPSRKPRRKRGAEAKASPLLPNASRARAIARQRVGPSSKGLGARPLRPTLPLCGYAAVVATSREGHRSPISGREGQHLRRDREQHWEQKD